MGTNSTSDQYSRNESEDSTSRENQQNMILMYNYSCMVVGLAILVFHAIAIRILLSCRKVPQNSRFLSINFFGSELIGNIFFLMHQFVMFVLNFNNDVTENTRIMSVSAGLVVSWASVAAMAAERVITLKANLRYSSQSRKSTYVIIGLFWVLHSFILGLVAIYGFQIHCKDWDLKTCDFWKASKPFRFTMLGFLIVYQTVLLVSYIIIFKIASRHARAIDTVRHTSSLKIKAAHPGNVAVSQRQYMLTKAVLKVVLCFMLLHAPMILHLIVMETGTIRRESQLRKVLHALAYICIQINSFVSLSVYVGKFEECKMHLYNLLGHCMKNYREKGEKLRVQVYNIVVSSEVERDRRPSVQRSGESRLQRNFE